MNKLSPFTPQQKSQITLLVILLIIVAGYVVYTNTNFLQKLVPEISKTPETQEPVPKVELPKNLTAEALAKAVEEQIINVIKKTSPAVVSIIASAEVPVYERYYRTQPFFNDPFFDDYFGFQVPEYRQKGTEKQRIGAGTGFIVSSDGYIITNKHVVENEEAEYTVILNHGEEKDETVIAQVLARDPIKDIAILKIDKINLPYIKMGDSSNLQVGQTAIAIGYALGEFDNTVSKGIISGLSREITASSGYGQSEQLEGIIQTDAAINAGNSGGPLLNIEGQAIGVNVAVAQASENIGFALPINDIKRSFESVKNTGVIEYPSLGVRYAMITKEIQEKNNLPYDYGALIVRGQEVTDLAVIPGSPADKAGLVENDIILEVNGTKVESENNLAKLILEHSVGETITLKVYHKGEEKEVKATLEARK